MYFWRIDPFSFKLDSHTELVDVLVKKTLSYREGNCNASDDYDYISNIRIKNAEYELFSNVNNLSSSQTNAMYSISFFLPGCVKSEYKEHSKAGREHKTEIDVITAYPNCTMPWRQSMLDEHWSTDYNQEDVSTCNDTEIKALYVLDYAFLKDAASLNIKNCPGR